MPHRSRYGIHCPVCESTSRVLGTSRYENQVDRARMCKGAAHHVFETFERGYQCTPPDGWGLICQTLNTRNLFDRTLRERVLPCGTAFKTIERVRVAQPA